MADPDHIPGVTTIILGAPPPPATLQPASAASRKDSDNEKPLSYLITLVHGTFGSRSTWKEEGSALRHHLIHSLVGGDTSRLHIEKFDWSGANAPRERMDAAKRLAAQLEEQVHKHPTSRHFLICHSHGGNVALYSLRHCADALRRLDGIVCFGTPFICLLPRNTERLLLNIGLIAFPFLAFALSQGIPFNKWLRQINDPWLNLLAVLLSILFLAIAMITLTKRSRHYVAKLVSSINWIKANRVDIIKKYCLPSNENVPLLCVWSAGDEAFGWLRFGEILNNSVFILFHYFSLIALLLLAIGAQISGWWPVWFMEVVTGPPSLNGPNIYLEWLLGEVPAEWDGIVSNVFAVTTTWQFYFISAGFYEIAIIIGALTIVGIVGAILTLWPFGITVGSIFSALFVRITFSFVPLNAEADQETMLRPANSIFFPVSSTIRQMSHTTMYDDADVLLRVGWWIQSRAKGQSRSGLGDEANRGSLGDQA